MQVGCVIGHDVDDDADASRVQGGRQCVEVGEGAEAGIDVAVVGHVISAIGEGRRVEGAQPDGVDPEIG